MKDSFLDRISTVAASVFAFVFTIAGAIYSIQSNTLLVWILFLVSITVVFLLVAYMFYRERNTARTSLAEEQEKRREAEKRLEESSSVLLNNLILSMRTWSFAETLSSIGRVLDLIERMRSYQNDLNQELKVLKFHAQGQVLFVVASPTEDTVRHIQEHDPFYLVHTSEDGPTNRIATTKVHQPPRQNSPGVFFRIEAVDNEDHLDALKRLAAQSDVRLAEGYTLEPVIDLENFIELDLLNAQSVISAIRENKSIKSSLEIDDGS